MKEHCAEPGRFARQGFPEAVYGPGKTALQIIAICKKLAQGVGPVLVTRIDEKTFKTLKKRFPKAFYSAVARLAVLKRGSTLKTNNGDRVYICVVTAGTTDMPAAEEAAKLIAKAQVESAKIVADAAGEALKYVEN